MRVRQIARRLLLRRGLPTALSRFLVGLPRLWPLQLRRKQRARPSLQQEHGAMHLQGERMNTVWRFWRKRNMLNFTQCFMKKWNTFPFGF